MDILFNIGQAFVMGLIAFTITRWGYVKQIKILYLQGCLNRLQFLIGLIGMTIVVGLFNTMIATMMDSVVILIAYWGVRILSFLGHSVLLSFYFVLYARRFQDFSFHGVIGILWCIFIAFTYPYLPIKSTSAAFAVLIWIVNLILLVIPGSSKPNKYGLPAIWPQKRVARPQRTRVASPLNHEQQR